MKIDFVKYPVFIAIIQFLVTLCTDKFAFGVFRFEHFAMYLLVKILLFVVLYAFWKFVYKVIIGVKEGNRKIINGLKIFFPVLLINLIFLIAIFPGNWVGDEIDTYLGMREMTLFFWQGMFHSFFFMLTYSICPFPAFICFSQISIMSAIIAYIVNELWEIYKNRFVFIIPVLLCIPVCLIHNLFMQRCSICAYLELLLYSFICIKSLKKEELTNNNIAALTILSIIFCSYRTEAAPFFIFIALAIILFFKHKSRIKQAIVYSVISVLFISFFMSISSIGLNEHNQKNGAAYYTLVSIIPSFNLLCEKQDWRNDIKDEQVLNIITSTKMKEENIWLFRENYDKKNTEIIVKYFIKYFTNKKALLNFYKEKYYTYSNKCSLYERKEPQFLINPIFNNKFYFLEYRYKLINLFNGKYFGRNNVFSKFYIPMNYLYSILFVMLVGVIAGRKEFIFLGTIYSLHAIIIITLSPWLNNTMYSFFLYIGALVFLPIGLIELKNVIYEILLKFAQWALRFSNNCAVNLSDKKLFENKLPLKTLCSLYLQIIKERQAQLLKLFFVICVALIILKGIYLRIKVYSFGLPLWMDELGYSMVIVNKKLHEIFYATYGIQKFPLLFMLPSFVLAKLCNYSVYALRVIPLVSSIASIFGLSYLLRNTIKSKILVLIGLLLFCVNPTIIYYAQEFKTYSSDIFAAILMLVLYSKFNAENKNIRYYILCFLCTLCISLFSFSCLYIIPAIFIVELIRNKKITKASICVLMGYLCANLYSFLILKGVIESETKLPIWINGYLDISFKSFYAIARDFYYYAFDFANQIECNYFLIVIFAGIIMAIISRNKIMQVIVCSLLLALIGSLIKFYPLYERAIVYFIPLVILLGMKAFDFKKPDIRCLLTGIMIGVFLCYGALTIPRMEINNDRYMYFDRIVAKRSIMPLLANYKKSEAILLDETAFDLAKYYNKAQKYNHELNITVLYNDNEFMLESKLNDYLERNKNTNRYIAFSNINLEKSFINGIEDYFKENEINYTLISNTEYMKIYKIGADEIEPQVDEDSAEKKGFALD